MLIAILVLNLFLACRKPQNVSDKTVPLGMETKGQTNTPFSNKELEIFQTKILVTMNLNEKTSTKTYFVARNGAKSLTTFNFGEDNETSILENENGKSFILRKKEKSYLERTSTNANPKQSELNKFLTTKWLNEKRNVSFEKIDAKNNLTTYRVNFEDSKGSEILIYIDENLHVPVKQEFFETKNGKKTLVFMVELKDFKTSTHDKLFELPNDYKNKTTQ